MSGLLALLDDVAGIAKVAAASVDDVIGQAAKAGAKAAGAVIDDAAVTPKYVQGFEAHRELPIIWRIARGSIVNKLVFLLPVGLILSAFAAWLIPPLLMLGGAYLCFEGAEKVAHAFGAGHDHGGPDGSHDVGDPAHLEEEKVAGAIKTDFILSAEIMTIALAAIPESSFWMEAATLAVVATGITVAVYGAVAVIVKADDFGMFLAKHGKFRPTRMVGRGVVKSMPMVLRLLMIIGTAAMLWVGGSIIIHGLKEMGAPQIYDWTHHLAENLRHGLGSLEGLASWLLVAGSDGLLGLAFGFILIPVGTKIVTPIWRKIRKMNPLT